jgi:hypothetical protein
VANHAATDLSEINASLFAMYHPTTVMYQSVIHRYCRLTPIYVLAEKQVLAGQHLERRHHN